MTRIAWSHLALFALGLSLVSCFGDETSCPTCPPEDGAGIIVQVTANGEVDSVQVAIAGGAILKIRRGQRDGVGGLRRGTHGVEVVRWIQRGGLSLPREASFEIQLEQGEIRVLVFHNDFPLIAWDETSAADRADREWPPGRSTRGGDAV